MCKNNCLLIVDDDERGREALKILLAQENYRLAFAACGGGGADCDAVKTAYDKCYSVGGDTTKSACEAENTAGICTRTKYWACYTDNECSDTNDTDTLQKIADCVTGNAACEI